QSGGLDNADVTGFENVDASLSAVAVSLTGSTGDNILIGGSDADTIYGGDGADTLTGGLGADGLYGGLGNDILVVDGDAGDAVTGETYNGGDNTDTLQVNGDADFTGSVIESIEKLELGSTATFTSDQLGTIYLSSSLNVSGTDGHLDKVIVDVVDGALVVDLSQWTFASTWLPAADGDLIVINGSGITDDTKDQILTGTSQVDLITGGAGDDMLYGGDSDDTFVNFVGADQVFGGDGTGDTIRITIDGEQTTLKNAGNDDIQGVEIIDAATAPDAVIIDLSNQVEGFTITGSAHGDTLTGSQGADTIYGGDSGDTLAGGLGIDLLYGGDGNDILVVDGDAGDAVTGETYNGGANTDTLQVTGDADFTGSTITSIEKLTLGSTATFTSDQLGAGLSSTLNVAGTDGHLDKVIIDVVDTALTVDLSLWTFASTWLPAADGDLIVINGAGITDDTKDQVLTGTSQVDLITGGAGDDMLYGGASDDTFVDFVGADQVFGGDGTGDTIRITIAGVQTDLNAAIDDDIQGVEKIDASGVLGVVGVTINLSGQNDGFEITGTGNADVLTGSSVADTIYGGAGNDTIVGFVGTDTVDGGADTDTITLAATSNDLNTATDLRIINVEAISAALAAAGVTIDLSSQTEGFAITGSGHADLITGSTGADAIFGGAGDDTFIGFVGADAVDGGADTDTIVLAATSGDLNAATNSQIKNVEVIDASTAGAGVTIDLHQQNDGFTITGSGQGDSIIGSSGADTINAGTGNDTIVGFVGADTVDGGADTDTITLAATSTDLNAATDLRIVNVEAISAALAAAGVTIDLHLQTEGFTVTGGSHNDTITGSAGGDTINTGNGNDVAIGGAGVDVIDTGIGDDRIAARVGDGNDFYDGGAGNDTIDYSATNGGVTVRLTPEDRSGESVSGDPGSIAALLLKGGISDATTAVAYATGGDSGTDILLNIENVIGSSGDDSIVGDGFANILEGGGGADKIWARAGNDTVRGGAGNDILVGGFGGTAGLASGNDTLYGDEGNDELYGEDGNDSLWGGTGSDQYAGGKGKDILYFEGDGASDTAWGGDDSDRFVFFKGFGIDTIKDFLATGGGSDKIDLSNFKGLTFSDLKISQVGDNTEIGGLGKGNGIILEVVNAGAITKDDFIFATTTVRGSKKNDVMVGTAGNDRLKGLGGNDKLKGKAGDDTLIGGKGRDKLLGGAGNDVLKGNGGNDKITGGTGDDIATGGKGKDSFIFKSASEGFDTIKDFMSGVDNLQIKASGFGGGLVAGDAAPLVKLADIAGYTHASSKGVFLFDTSGADMGTLYWDANGGSSSDAIAFVTIGSSSLLQSDLHIV
ncbi:MAG: hypothetical protein KDJ88_18795, partial [Bauldia sp.]|nr:hypothetical protein [Bauldia sp.]